MSTVIYEFTANHATELWSTNPEKMVDGTETSYASTTTDGDIQCLITNECVGTDLGTISKAEIRAYAYSDDNDQLILRPVFGGTADGDNHTTVPGVTAGWGDWQDITSDPNNPTIEENLTSGDDSDAAVWTTWRSQTFTVANAHSIASVAVYGRKTGSSGDVTLSIRATVDSMPSGEDLVSATVLEADLPTENGWVLFSFASPYALSAATKYAIVMRALAGTGTTNCFHWRRDNDGGYDGGGYDYSSDGSSWNGETAGVDCLFKDQRAWSWSDIQDLDCDLELNDVSKGNTMYCGMVQIQVTYEPAAEGIALPILSGGGIHSAIFGGQIVR